MHEEFLAIQRNKTWDFLDVPKGKKLIGLKWVFTTTYQAKVYRLRKALYKLKQAPQA